MINGGIVGGYYGKDGGGTGGGISQAALNTAINNLKTALEAEIAKKADDAGNATDAEVTSAISTLETALQAKIDEKSDESSVVTRLRAKANTATVTALGKTLRTERAGVLLNETAQQTVANLNSARTDAQVIDDIGFSTLPIFRGELDDYDRFLMEVSELGSDGSTIIDSTSVAFTFAVWDSLKEVPVPAGDSFVAAHTDDNRALRWAWHNNPPAAVDITLPVNRNQRDVAVERAVETLSANIRSSSRVLYVGKSVADTTASVAQRMLIAVTGIKNNFRCRVYGYRGT